MTPINPVAKVVPVPPMPIMTPVDQAFSNMEVTEDTKLTPPYSPPTSPYGVARQGAFLPVAHPGPSMMESHPHRPYYNSPPHRISDVLSGSTHTLPLPMIASGPTSTQGNISNINNYNYHHNQGYSHNNLQGHHGSGSGSDVKLPPISSLLPIY